MNALWSACTRPFSHRSHFVRWLAWMVAIWVGTFVAVLAIHALLTLIGGFAFPLVVLVACTGFLAYFYSGLLP